MLNHRAHGRTRKHLFLSMPPEVLQISSSLSRCCRSISIVPSSIESRRTWWVLVSFSVTTPLASTSAAPMNTSHLNRSISRQRSAHSSPRRAPLARARRIKSAKASLTSRAASTSLAQSAWVAFSSTWRRCTGGGDAALAGFATRAPHLTACSSMVRNRA